MSKNKDEGIFIDLTASCTIDNALRQLLGIGTSTSNDLNESELADVDTLETSLLNIYENAEVDYSNAIFEKQSDEDITLAFEKLNKAKLLNDNARRYRIDIVDELSNGSKSKLKIDPDATSDAKGLQITISSFNKWALEKYGITLSKNPSRAKPLDYSDELWNIRDPRDITPLQPWYTQARFFARQLVLSDPTLHEKRNLLVIKIAQELKNKGIYKRGGRKPPSPETIKKALANVKYK